MQEVHYSREAQFQDLIPADSFMLGFPVKIYALLEHMADLCLKVHQHLEYAHIWYVINGSARILINGRKYYASANEFLLIPPNTWHGMEVERNSRVFDLKFVVDQEIAPSGELLGERALLFDEYGLSTIIEKLLGEFKDRNVNWETMVNSYSCELIIKAVRIYKTQEKGLVGFVDRGQDPLYELVKEMEAFINGNFTEDLNLQYLGETFNYNPRYLSSVFRKVRGITINQAINEARIRHAQLKLKDASMSIEQVATDVGYNDHSYFTRLFKQMTGMTPTQFREMSII